MPRTNISEARNEEFLNVIRRLQEDVESLKTSFANKFRLISQNDQPTLTVDAEVILWRRTSDDTLWFIARANGVDKKVQLT